MPPTLPQGMLVCSRQSLDRAFPSACAVGGQGVARESSCNSKLARGTQHRQAAGSGQVAAGDGVLAAGAILSGECACLHFPSCDDCSGVLQQWQSLQGCLIVSSSEHTQQQCLMLLFDVAVHVQSHAACAPVCADKASLTYSCHTQS